jgi:hypothetical protein
LQLLLPPVISARWVASMGLLLLEPSVFKVPRTSPLTFTLVNYTSFYLATAT